MILNDDEIRQIYATGQGTIKLRGTYEPHPEPDQGDLDHVDSLRHRERRLVERIGESDRQGQVPQLPNVKDLSTDDVRILLELKPGRRCRCRLAYLFKTLAAADQLQHQSHVPAPGRGGRGGAPSRLDLKAILQQFLDFRLEIVTRRLRIRAGTCSKRIHILEGFAIVFKNLDEAIAIIRASDGKADAAPS